MDIITILQISLFFWGAVTFIGFSMLFGGWPAGVDAPGLFKTGLFHLCLSIFSLKKIKQETTQLSKWEKTGAVILVLFAISMVAGMFI